MRISDWSSDVCSSDLNNHRCRSEVHLHVHGQARGEHVVRTDDEADYTNRDHGIGHAQISEDRLAAEGGDDLAYDTKARKDHDVNFGVTEEPEQMLIKDRIATASRIIEGGAEIAICEQHGDASGQ